MLYPIFPYEKLGIMNYFNNRQYKPNNKDM